MKAKVLFLLLLYANILPSQPTGPVVKKINHFKISPENESGTPTSTEKYNEKGKQIRHYSYDLYGRGNVSDSTQFYYDSQDRLIRKVKFDGQVTTTQYTFNEHGKVATEKWSRDNGDNELQKLIYNRFGDLLEIKYFDKENKYDFSRVFERMYDGRGRVIEEKKIEKYTDDSPSLLQYHIKFEYGDKDLVIKKSRFTDAGLEDMIENFTYNLSAKLVEEKKVSSYGNSTEVERVEYIFNPYGEVILEEYYLMVGEEEVLQFTNTYRYDQYGHQTYMMYEANEGKESWGERTAYDYY